MVLSYTKDGYVSLDLLTTCYDNDEPSKAVYGNHSEKEIMDPTKNSTFEFLERFFREIKDIFKDDFLHLGMDEVHYMCWQSSPIIQEFMAKLGIPPGEYSGLETYYSQRLLSLIRPMNKRVVIWEDPVNHGAQISNDTLIQVWKDKNSPPGSSDWQIHLNDAINKGFQVIFSSCWYLNLISYGQDWTKYYLCEPFNINASVEDLKNIIGGEACLWSEFTDESNLLSILWPRASAVAERLWSPAHVNDTQEATFRLDQHRCRMIRHGIPAKPLLPGYCRENYNTDNSWLLPSHKSHDESMTTIKPTTTKKSGNSSTRLLLISGTAWLILYISLFHFIQSHLS
ncbi:hypothetical protein Btru_072905 [Bulinus truncatus]|nr:hypothetical protein Btru_072905 [Bulinus truncatus]